VLANPKELRVESKEQFFTTRNKQKRMKKSTCFSEQIEIEQNNSALDSSMASIRSEDPLRGCCKELESTFGEENVLVFKAKPPKRKRNIPRRQDRLKKEESSSSSECESPTKNSLILSKKTGETAKPPLCLF
jgi:hypothetical protein